MGKKLILFGAGMYAKTYKAILDYLKIEFHYYTDNDCSKFETVLYDKKIISPYELTEMDCDIIMSCTYEEEIKLQLEQMNISNKLKEVEEIYIKFNQKMVENASSICKTIKKDKKIIIDMFEGIGWGGSEMWAVSTAKSLLEIGHSVKILGSDKQIPLNSSMEAYVQRFSEEQAIEKMASEIEANLPCTVINNFAGCVMLAAVLVKNKYPDDLQIISVIHNDNPGVFKAHLRYESMMETIFCVSREIKEKIINEYNICKNKIYFKEPYIEYESDYQKIYNTTGSAPLRIGYAGRLVKQAKRTDMLPQIISLLEANKINYQLEVAGDGECKKMIEEYVKAEHLQKKVKLWGRIPKEEMSEFWKLQDVFINFSEHEGTSLAMLESMSYGCVPIVTIVSGVREYVKDHVNGFICKVGDLESLVFALKKIEQNRMLLPQYGLECRKIIKERCNKEDYISFFEKLL